MSAARAGQVQLDVGSKPLDGLRSSSFDSAKPSKPPAAASLNKSPQLFRLWARKDYEYNKGSIGGGGGIGGVDDDNGVLIASSSFGSSSEASGSTLSCGSFGDEWGEVGSSSSSSSGGRSRSSKSDCTGGSSSKGSRLRPTSMAAAAAAAAAAVPDPLAHCDGSQAAVVAGTGSTSEWQEAKARDNKVLARRARSFEGSKDVGIDPFHEELLRDLKRLLARAGETNAVADMRAAAEALRELSRGSPEAVARMAEAGGVSGVMQALTAPLPCDWAAVEDAVIATCNLTLCGRELAGRLVDCGVLLALATVLRNAANADPPNLSVQANVAGAIFGLLQSTSPTASAMLAGSGLPERMLRLAAAAGEHSEGRRDALRVLIRLCEGSGSSSLSSTSSSSRARGAANGSPTGRAGDGVRRELVRLGAVGVVAQFVMDGDESVTDECAGLLLSLSRTEDGARRMCEPVGKQPSGGKPAQARAQGIGISGGCTADESGGGGGEGGEGHGGPGEGQAPLPEGEVANDGRGGVAGGGGGRWEGGRAGLGALTRVLQSRRSSLFALELATSALARVAGRGVEAYILAVKEQPGLQEALTDIQDRANTKTQARAKAILELLQTVAAASPAAPQAAAAAATPASPAADGDGSDA